MTRGADPEGNGSTPKDTPPALDDALRAYYPPGSEDGGGGAPAADGASSEVREKDGIFEVVGDIKSPYINHDLFPTRLRDRKWGMRDIAALWISMSACVPTYMLASSLIAEGMSWWQAVLTITLGNAIVLLPMILNAHAGTKYGIPFPVYCRAAFGIRGANAPAVLRALVACGWFGIQA